MAVKVDCIVLYVLSGAEFLKIRDEFFVVRHAGRNGGQVTRYTSGNFRFGGVDARRDPFEGRLKSFRRGC